MVVDNPKVERCATVGDLYPVSVVNVGTVPTESQQSETECLMIDHRRCLLQIPIRMPLGSLALVLYRTYTIIYTLKISLF